MFSRLKRISLLITMFVAGLWLLLLSTTVAPESAARQEAMQALAPAGAGGSGQVIEADRLQGAVVPVSINLADIPSGVYDPNNQLDRWQRGEIDLDEIEGIRSRAELAAMREAALSLPASETIHLADSGPTVQAPAGGVGFDSLDYTECCGGGGNVPPDPELAVGPNHAIAVVNVAFEIYDKNGNVLKPATTFESFMSGARGCSGVFDPNVLYDESSDRYILGIDADGRRYCLAVSATGDPLGTWHVYSFSTGNDFFDYPHAGVGNDAIYMGGNIFQCTFISCSFKEARIWAFDKAAMYAGSAAGSVTHALAFSEDTPQPLNLHGWNQGTWPAGGPHYILTETNYDGAHYSVFAWTDPFGTNTVSLVGTMDLVAATGVPAGMPVDVPQQGSTAALQANDFRPQDFEYRNGYGWTVQTIACNPGGGTVDCIRWAQIDPVTATVVDAGVYASDSTYRFFGDLAVNHCNDMAVGYTKSSSSMYPGIWVTGRESSDSAGTLQPETELKAGELTYTAFDTPPHRWGDYTEMTIAPDGVTFWYLGEYSKNTGTSNGRWGTYIGSFSFANCETGGDPPTPTPTHTPGPTPTASPTPTNTPEATPTATPGSASGIHVGDLDGTGAETGRGKWRATIVISVHDGIHNPVADARVSGSWSGGTNGNSSCTTDSSGQCSLTSNNVNLGQSATFTVTNVRSGAGSYNAADNHDPDGDSDGTSITVTQ